MKDQTDISPVTKSQRTQIIRATNDAIAKAEKIFLFHLDKLGLIQKSM